MVLNCIIKSHYGETGPPGWIRPDIVKDAAKQVIPMRKFGTVDDIAKAIAFLTSDDTGYITGQVLCVDGGMAM